VRARRSHTSDQGAVWAEVQRQAASLGSSSATHAMSDTFDSYRARLDEFRDRLRYVEGATGVAVAVGPDVVAVDLFDRPSTCRKVWDRLLSGVVMDALEAREPATPAEPAKVADLLARVTAAAWEPAPAVGEGQEFRSDAVPSVHASALLFDDAMLHGSVVVGG
jgi:hypothetical protein